MMLIGEKFKSSLINDIDYIQRLTTAVSAESVNDLVKNFTHFPHGKLSTFLVKLIAEMKIHNVNL